jgi:hypothetical protein
MRGVCSLPGGYGCCYSLLLHIVVIFWFDICKYAIEVCMFVKRNKA